MVEQILLGSQQRNEEHRRVCLTCPLDQIDLTNILKEEIAMLQSNINIPDNGDIQTQYKEKEIVLNINTQIKGSIR